MRKILGTFGATVLAGITAAAIATPAAAAACVPVEAVPATEAVYETVEVTPAQPAVPAVEEVSHVESTGWTTDVPAGEEWVEVDRREVVDVEAVPAWTEVVTNDDEIPARYEQTDWVLTAPEDGRTWTQIAEREVIDVEAQPAVGEPTITIDNPDYVPAWTETIEHEAVTEQVHVSTTYKKWKLFGWEYKDFPPTANPQGWKFVQKNYETCVIEEAWTETIEHPAIGEPTITIDNPDYVPAVEQVSHYEYKFAWYQPYVPPTTYTVEHEAIEQVSHLEYIFERTVIDVAAVPGVDAVPAVTEQVLVSAAVPATEAVVCPAAPQFTSQRTTTDRPDDAPVQDESLLAETGADGIRGLTALGLLLLGLGVAVIMVGTKTRRD